jgi:phage/plasmid-like protein (TIGR03299 family)
MSHELEMINGAAQMVFTGPREAIWHGLGTQIPDDLAPAEVMAAAGLDWTVEKLPLTARMADGSTIDTNHSALVRSSDNSVLDVVPSSWNPVQNAEAFTFFDEFIDAGQMKMDTAGSIRNGRKVWALAKLNDGFELFGGDKIEGYLLFSNPHYFGRCVDIKFTPVRVVCNNTLTMALTEVNENQVRHSHRTEFDADRVKTVLGLASRKLELYEEQAKILGDAVYTNDNAIEFMSKVFPVLTQKRESRKTLSKQAERALQIVEGQPGAEFRPGSFWNLFNAVTYITTNEYGRKAENRLDSVWYGQNAQRNQRAMNLALEMAQAA